MTTPLASLHVALFRDLAAAYDRHAPAMIDEAKAQGFGKVQILALLAAPFVDVIRHVVTGSLRKGASLEDVDVLTRVALHQAATSFATVEAAPPSGASQH